MNVGTGVTFSQSLTTTFSSSPTLTLTGAGNSIFTGAMTGGSSGIVVNGTGTVTLTAANNYSGNTTVTSGLLSIGDAIQPRRAAPHPLVREPWL